MPIKKSQLEQKWYYRVAKVILLVLPVLAVAYLVSRAGFPFATLSQKTLAEFFTKNINSIVLTALGIVAYFVLLNLVWRTMLYVTFGGLINDTMKAPDKTVTAQGRPNDPNKNNNEVGLYLFILIIIVLMYWIYNYQPLGQTAAKNSQNDYNRDNPTCISTGCGNLWRCDGSYYLDGQQLSVHACLPRKAGEIYSGWTGTCRQCP